MKVQQYSDFELFDEGNYFYIITSSDYESYEEIDGIEINKNSKEIKPTRIRKSFLGKDSGHQKVHGILGFIKLVKNFYMIVITKRELIGKIMNNDVYMVKEIKILCCDNYVFNNDKIDEMDRYYIKMINDHFKTVGFYFSYTFDMTRRMEKWFENYEDKYSSLLEFNVKFMWNRHLLQSVMHIKEIHQYFLPIIHGYVKIENLTSNNNLTLILISRRNNQRVGTRYFNRGADLNGNASNFVETETILIAGEDLFSFVQVRGSIPLIWNQYPNLMYKPRVSIDPNANQVIPMIKHFDKEISERGCNIVINLVDNKSDEKILGNTFSRYIERLNASPDKLQYIYFDFHKNCAGMKFERVNILLDKIEDARIKLGYFHIHIEDLDLIHSEDIVKKQTGTFRTNCMDCLDRTNVVQSMISWRNIISILEEIKNKFECPSIKIIENAHKNLWADNADYLSIQYSATPALKTDFTRNGVRTYKGIVMDGVNSIVRYLHNNFYDGYRQDSLDLVCGNYKFNINLSESYPKVNKTVASAFLPILLLTLTIILCGDIFLLNNSYQLRICVALMDIWFISIIVRYILRNPYKYVNFPLLISLNDHREEKKQI